MRFNVLSRLFLLPLFFLLFHAKAQTTIPNVTYTTPFNADTSVTDPLGVVVGSEIVVDNCVLTINGNLTLNANVFLRGTGTLSVTGTTSGSGKVYNQIVLAPPISTNLTGPSVYVVESDLTVAKGSDITISGTSLTVTGRLTLNGNIYLRNGGQLIQNHSGVTTNDGTGVLSVYQEGAADVHQFNYWCSPVGNITSSTENNPFSILQLGRPITVTGSDFAANTIFNPNPPVATTMSFKPYPITTTADYDGVTTNTSLAIAPYWIYTFDQGTSYGQWNQVGTGSISPGYGFTMKGTAGTDNVTAGESADAVSGKSAQNNPDGLHQRYDFRGKPNDGDIMVPVSLDSNGNGNFTLIGNPYPCALDLEKFFEDTDYINTNSTDGIAYFWEQGPTSSHQIANYTGGYGVYSPYTFATSGSPVYIPATFYTFNDSGSYVAAATCSTCSNPGNPDRGYVPVGQGFMVKADPTTFDNTKPYIILKNDYRIYVPEGTAKGPNNISGSVFSKKAEQPGMPQIRFATTVDNGPIGQMVQVFIPESTVGIDKGKDAVNPNNYPAMVNFLVKNKRCVISAVPFDVTRKLPLIFDNVNQANYKITVKEMINLDQVSNVYLHDKTADTYTDIKNGFADITLPKGMNYTQYEIAFQDSSKLGLSDITEKSFVIYQNNTAKKMIVSNPMSVDIATCDLYDITGKFIFSKNNLGIQSSYEFSTAELRDGIYITKITTRDNKTRSQKIIVKY